MFVYELGANCPESWGRAAVEAMFCGAVPQVPRGGGHHMEHLVRSGESGFLGADRGEFGEYAKLLQDDAVQDVTSCALLVRRGSLPCGRHRRMWREVL